MHSPTVVTGWEGKMRLAAVYALATSVYLAQSSDTIFAQTLLSAMPPDCHRGPNALGVSRVVEINTSGGPAFGFEHFKEHDFLRDKEVVLTFDDGPWATNTPAVLSALAAQCAKATFFPIG